MISIARFYSIFLIVLAAMLVGFAPIFTRLALVEDGTSLVGAGFWRMFYAGLAFSLATVLMRGLGASFEALKRLLIEDRVAAIGAGLFFGLDLAAWHSSFAYTTVASSSLIANLSSVLIPVIGVIYFREKLTRSLLVGGVLAMSGVALLVLYGGSPVIAKSPESRWIGDLLAFLTAFMYTGYMFCTKKLVAKRDTFILMMVTSSFSAIFLLVFCLVFDFKILPATSVFSLNLLGVGLVAHFLGQGLLAFSLKKVPLSVSALLILIAPVSAGIYGMYAFDEALTTGQTIGVIVTVIGIGTVAFFQNGTKKKDI